MNQLMGELQPAAALSPSRFHCLLDEQPTQLVPGRLTAEEAVGPALDRPFFVNPRCCFSRNGTLPEDAAGWAFLLDDFALDGDIVWVSDPGTQALQPFWLGPRLSRLFCAVKAGDPAPEVPADVLPVLLQAGVLVDEQRLALRGDEWLKTASFCAQQFQQKQYVPVGGLIRPYHLAALRRYYRQMIRKGKLPLGDNQVARRYGAHNESVARFFHHQLAPAVSAIVGEPVKPSYVYFASYQSGSILEKHVDRAQCEFSLTFCLDYSPEPVRQTPWPLHLESREGRVTVFQAIGDGLLYRGRELPHYRHALPEGNTSTSFFFHYVAKDFEGKLD